MIEIIVIIVVLIVVIILTLLTIKLRNKDTSYHQESIDDSYFTQEPIKRDVESFYTKTKFDEIISAIKNKFHPTRDGNEEEYEKQLVNFLNSRFPKENYKQKGRKPRNAYSNLKILSFLDVKFLLTKKK